MVLSSLQGSHLLYYLLPHPSKAVPGWKSSLCEKSNVKQEPLFPSLPQVMSVIHGSLVNEARIRDRINSLQPAAVSLGFDSLTTQPSVD